MRETDKIISQKSKRYYWSIFGKLNLTKKPFFPDFQHQVAFAEKSLFLLLFPPLESEYAKTLCTFLLNSILRACVLNHFSRVRFCNPVDCRLPRISVHGILQERILEWVATPCSRGSFQPRDQTWVSCVFCITGGFFTAEPLGTPQLSTQFSSV